MINLVLIVLGKLIAAISRFFNLGHGSTWPGHIALFLNKNFIKDNLKQTTKDQPASPAGGRLKTILIAGTNGKTTTSRLIQTILESDGRKVFQNESGANLLNGIASTLILYCNVVGKLRYDYAIFEVDENTLALVLQEFDPDYLILLNLFRDQLDRYGEVNTIAKKWQEALSKLPKKTIVILNADDPQIAYLGKSIKNKVLYFGINDRKLGQTKYQHATDSTYCPQCGTKLSFDAVYFSHLGIWYCQKCQLKRPQLDISTVDDYPLPGVYNKYNTNATVLFARLNQIGDEVIKRALKQFSPAFGRQETIDIDGKKVQIFLSKNPTSFNESLRTVKDLGGQYFLIVLNDKIPDGRDVSWIWDVDTEELIENRINIVVSGDRVYDMALRIKYSSSTKFSISNFKFQIEEDLKRAITLALEQIPRTETLYILPTYSAMLEVRRILTGRKIL